MAELNDIRFSNIEKTLDKHEERITKLEERVSALEQTSAVSANQIELIFTTLTEIKDSISSISNKLDVLKEKPDKFIDNQLDMSKQFKLLVYGAIITAIVSMVMSILT